MTPTPEELARVLRFCPACFASSEDGSWGYTCDEHYCYNCGAGGTVELPFWAIRSIRKQASWVGKRYYPHEEDRETREELAALRALAPANPHDTAELDEEGYYYRVTRRDPVRKVTTTITPIRAGSAEEALRIGAQKLRYIPLERYEVKTS